jgi:hypothetical protein
MFHPVLYLGFFKIVTTKELYASKSPVINQGLSKEILDC